MVDQESIEYFRERERAERAAAANAASEEARIRHLELAQGYADRIRDAVSTKAGGNAIPSNPKRTRK